MAKLHAFVELLREYRLLSPDQLDEVRQQQARRHDDVRALAKYLVQRGWLTVFQVNQLLQDRGGELVIGPCLVLDQLGEGAVNQVFKAWHPVRSCLVALKALRPDLVGNREAVRQLDRESEAMARLSHPNVIRLLESDRVGQRRYLVMEYVEGIDLEHLVQLSGQLPIDHACDFIRQAALGLQHAHEHGLVHRDVKPGNLLLTWSGELGAPSGATAAFRAPSSALVKVLDWGLACLEAPAHLLTCGSSWMEPGTLVGTPDYLSPEQARNPRGVDICADIYSLGCTLFFLLTGQPPFPGNSLMQKLLHHEEAEPPSVATLRPGLPRTLAPLLHAMLAKDPAARPQTPLAIAAALAPLARRAPVSRWGEPVVAQL